MSARIKLHARLFQFAGENRDEMLDAFLAEGLREAADQQWAFAREHWIPTEGDSPSAIRKKDHKFGAAERLISLIDPAAPALMPRHINTIPKGAGFLVRWQLGEETNSVWHASRPGADALAAELRDKGAGQAGQDTAPRCENPKCGRPITRGAQWCSTWCHQASDAQAGKDTASRGESTQPAPDYCAAVAEALRLLESAPEAFNPTPSTNIAAAANVLRQAHELGGGK